MALIGLLKAVERFDPDRGTAFAGFAVPTITGEIKRHFDRTWSIRVPRNLLERSRAIETARDALAHALGRSPTMPELAQSLGLSGDEILEGLEARTMYRSGSLDEPIPGTEGASLPDVVPAGRDDFAVAEDRSFIASLLAQLPPREHRAVNLRYFEGLTQAEITEPEPRPGWSGSPWTSRRQRVSAGCSSGSRTPRGSRPARGRLPS